MTDSKSGVASDITVIVSPAAVQNLEQTTLDGRFRVIDMTTNCSEYEARKEFVREER